MKLKFAFAYDSAYPWFNGGIEKRRFLIMHSLAKEGHEVHCFTMLREGMPGDEFRYKGIFYHCSGNATPNSKMYVHGRRNIRWPLKYALLVPFKLIEHDHFDLIDADAFPFLHLFTIALYAKAKRIPFVVTWHEVWSLEYWQKYLGRVGGAIGYFIELLSSKLTKNFISNSKETKKRLKEEFGKESVLFPAAVSSLELYSKDVKKKDQFIAVGRLVPEKRMDLVLKAIAESSAKVVVVGMGPEEKKLKMLAKSLGLEKRVRFVNRMSSERLFRSIKESKGLLMFSAREGLSLITLEAMMLGTPVFIVESTSLPDDVKELCFKLDEERIGRSLDDVLKEYKKYEEKTKEIREIVSKRYSADNAAEVYKRFMKDKPES